MDLYPMDWQHIQDTYPMMAPKDLGTHGYTGLQTMYIPKPIQKQAYTTKGKALEWYRSWNVSWNDPAAFFGSISSVATSKLMPCNKSESVMANDPTMRRHVAITGDLDGVVIKDETWLCLLPRRSLDSCVSLHVYPPCLSLPFHPLVSDFRCFTFCSRGILKIKPFQLYIDIHSSLTLPSVPTFEIPKNLPIVLFCYNDFKADPLSQTETRIRK